MTLGAMEASGLRRRKTMILRSFLSAMGAIGITLSGAGAADALRLPPAPTWGACGRSSSHTKTVASYPNSLKLTCGPYSSGSRTWGYNHILDNHRTEFSTLSAPVNRNWRDLAHWAIYYASLDPDVTRTRGQRTCKSRYLYLVDSNGRTVVKKIFRLSYNNETRRVTTVFPASTHCPKQ